ncbi:Uncharacterised protein [Mycobacteroides abscessus subsp. abscessus]|nr:Uncharacterised protein [Mycobacteroides abscessus subsp. abscessus]
MPRVRRGDDLPEISDAAAAILQRVGIDDFTPAAGERQPNAVAAVLDAGEIEDACQHRAVVAET